MRAFIAIELSDGSRVRIAKRLKNLQRELVGISIRWLPIENIHLTLKFFKELREDNLNSVRRVMDDVMSVSSPFELQMGGLGAYPNSQKARVIWVSINAHQMLDKLKLGLDEGLHELGYQTEKRPFSAHFTLGRVRRGVSQNELANIGETIDNQRPVLDSTIIVNEIVLFRSDLRSSGASYSKMHSAKGSRLIGG